MPSKNAVMFFRAEPRLATEIRRRAEEMNVTPSEFLRDLVRATLGLRPDYATQPSMDVEIVNEPNN